MDKQNPVDNRKEELREIAIMASSTALERADSNELLTRIDERVNHLLTVDMSEIKKHLETLNNNVAKNTERSISNKSQVRNLWVIIIAHLALLGTIIGLLVHYQG